MHRHTHAHAQAQTREAHLLQSRSLCFHGTFECTIATMDAYSRTEQQVPPHLMKADLVKLAEHIETTNQLRTLLQVCSPALHVFCDLPSFERCFLSG
jgi:hypothetical protein